MNKLVDINNRVLHTTPLSSPATSDRCIIPKSISPDKPNFRNYIQRVINTSESCNYSKYPNN